MAETSFGNPKTKVSMDKSRRSKSQTKDFNRRRCLNRFHNNNNGLKMELI